MSFKANYENLFATSILSNVSQIDYVVKRIVAGRPRYETVVNRLGTKMPWWILGIIHALEAANNFERHPHNGDPLSGRTINVPKRRPKNGNPPFVWEDSAVDALQGTFILDNKDWGSLDSILYKMELYNGAGYKNKGRLSPYIWGFTQHFIKGKYVKDGVYDPEAPTKAPGVAAIIKRMVELGIIDGALRGANVEPPQPKTAVVGDSIGISLVTNYPSYVAKDDKLVKNTLSELLSAMKASAVWSIYTSVILSIGSADRWAKPAGQSNGSQDPRGELIIQMRRVFPNAQFFIVNGTHGWSPELSAAAGCDDDCWTKKVAAYIMSFTDKGIKSLGQQRKLAERPKTGDDFYRGVEDDMKKYKILPEQGATRPGSTAPAGQGVSRGEFTQVGASTAPTSQRNQLSTDGIVNLFPPTIIPTTISIPTPDDVKQKRELTVGLGYVPVIFYNTFQIDFQDVSFFSIYFDGLLPHMNLLFKDSLGMLKDTATPLDNTKITVFISPRHERLRPVHIDFKIKTFVNEGGMMSIVGAMDVNGLYYPSYKSYPGFTSNFLLQQVCRDVGLGFNTNVVETSDTMTWMSTGERVYDFVEEILEHAYISDESFIAGNVDLYYNLNFVDVQKELSRDITSELGYADESLNRILEQSESGEMASMLLTNDESLRNSHSFFSGFRITNRSTDTAIASGYGDEIVYYDADNKSQASFSVDSMNLNPDRSIVMKAGNDDEFFSANRNFVYAGKANKDNSHSNFNFSKTHNERNILEADKLLMEIEIPQPNFNLYRYQKIRVIFSHNAPSPAAGMVNSRYTGDWMIADIRYVLMDGRFSQLVSLVKRELELTEEEVQSGIAPKARPSGRAGSNYRGTGQNPAPPNTGGGPNTTGGGGQAPGATGGGGSNVTVTVKNILIGDSQTPYVDSQTKKASRISEKPGEASLWEGGKGVSWLIGALEKFPVTPDVTGVVTVIGTNGGFGNDNIPRLFGLIRQKFPSAKIYSVKGSWGWGGNSDIQESTVNKYYDRFKALGSVIIEPPIGSVKDPHGNLPVYKLIGAAIDALL